MTYQSVSAFPRKLYLTVFGGMMLFGMHFFQSNIGGVGLDMPFNAMVWIFGAALISIGIWTIEKYRKLFYNKSLIIISLGVIGLWVPMLYPNQEAGEYALGRLMGLVEYLLNPH